MGAQSSGVWLCVCVAVPTLLFGSAPALAQAADVQTAAKAFQEAQQAQLAGDHARAAQLFVAADKLAPTPEALRSAIRSYVDAKQPRAAATLALEAKNRYPNNPGVTTLVDEVLAAAATDLTRLQVHCSEPCTLLLDGRAVTTEPVASVDRFISPGPHGLEARWDGGGELGLTIDGQPGGTLEQSFARPTKQGAPTTEVAAPAEEPTAAEAGEDGGGLSPVVFWIGLGATVATTGVGVLVGLDTLSARDDYEKAPTKSGFDDGVKKETLTNVLFIGAGALAVGTLVVALLTDWNGAPESEATLSPGVALGPDGGALQLRGAF